MIRIIKSIHSTLNSMPALGVVLSLIIASNVYLYWASEKEPFKPGVQARRDAVGLSYDKAHRFVYFYYYGAYFPLATQRKNLSYNLDSAKAEINERGDKLIMEYMHWSRLGESARIWAFMPDALVRGSPEQPSVKLFNSIVFVFSMLLLFMGFWRQKWAFFGLLLVLFINTTPYFWYEVYSRENLFSLLASGFFICLGLNVSVLNVGRKLIFKHFLLAGCSGLILGLLSEFRNELSILILALWLIYLLGRNTSIQRKALFLVVITLFYAGAKKTIRSYFEAKFQESYSLVVKAGGHPYTGERISGHKTWHAVYCGLGDFDTKYGHKWDDRLAYKYAVPILNERYKLGIKYSGRYHTDNYYDKARLYYIKFDEIEEYESIIKEKVLMEISSDPLWFGGILLKRIAKVLTVTIPFHNVGWIIFLLLPMLFIFRRWLFIKLLVISLPLSATPIIVYSGRGATYNSLFAYFVIVISVLFLLELIEERSATKTAAMESDLGTGRSAFPVFGIEQDEEE